MVEDGRAAGDGRKTIRKQGLTGLEWTAVGTGTASGTRGIEDEYRTVVDAVDEGADPSGETSIAPVLEGLGGDDTLLEFPEGRYYVDREIRLVGFENVGLRGHGDATLVPANYWGFRGGSREMFRLGTREAPGRDLRVENLRVDVRAPNTGARPLGVTVSDGLLVRDVEVLGRHDSGTRGVGRFRVQDPEGEGLVERFRAPDGGGGSDGRSADFLAYGGPSGIRCDDPHRGTITFRDCELGGFPGGGLCTSGGTGVVNVQGGVYRNSGTASIRLGGRAGRIEGAHVVVDDDPFGVPQDGVRLDYGDRFDLDDVTVDVERPTGAGLRVTDDVDGTVLRNSSVSMGENAHPAVRIDPGAGGAYLKDLDVAIEGSDSAVRIEGEDGPGVELDDVRITGDAGGERTRHAVYCERDGCNFRELVVDQPGDGRRGIALYGDDASLHDCSFTCNQRGITLFGDDARVRGCHSQPHDPGRYSAAVRDDASGVRFKDNEFPEGVLRI